MIAGISSQSPHQWLSSLTASVSTVLSQASLLAGDRHLRREFVRITALETAAQVSSLFGVSPTPSSTPVSPNPLITYEGLIKRMLLFTRDRLSVDWRKGPPYEVPPEVDQGKAKIKFGDVWKQINHQVLNDTQLKEAKVMWAFAPDDDFQHTDVINGRRYTVDMGDIMGSMTSIANPPEWNLHSVSPPYAQEYITSGLPDGRVDFVSPKTVAEFEEVLKAKTTSGSLPDVLMLSGLNVNIPSLLKMNAIARRYGVKEVWLGNRAALGPYKILQEAFDRVVWAYDGAAYIRKQLGITDFTPTHPPVKKMLADVNWLILDDQGQPQRANFKTLHLTMRFGCTKNCSFCNEGRLAGRSHIAGHVDEASHVERLFEIINDAYSKGVKRVYFVDPDFARPESWSDAVEGRVIEHLHSKKMSWSCITSVEALEARGDWMIERGMKSVYLGIESLAPSHEEGTRGGRLGIMARGWQDQSATIQLIKRLAQKGVLTFGLYILGNPGETVADIMEGVRRLKQVVPISQISTNQPFPGTDEFRYAFIKG